MLKITEGLRDMLMAYLATRPYKEVAQGINELSKLEKMAEPKTEEDKKRK